MYIYSYALCVGWGQRKGKKSGTKGETVFEPNRFYVTEQFFLSRKGSTCQRREKKKRGVMSWCPRGRLDFAESR
jgi:hypothetical protein